MDFMTVQYVEEQAKLGKIPALECSLEHHRQPATCTRGEMIDVLDKGCFDMGSELCACCHKFGRPCKGEAESGNECPLWSKQAPMGHRCCDALWYRASDAFNKFSADCSSANFREFQAIEKEVCDYIEAVLDKERAKECECSKESNRNNEDLEEFEIVDVCGDRGNILIIGKRVHFRFRTGLIFNFDSAIEIHQKLGQLIRTAQRQEAKKK